MRNVHGLNKQTFPCNHCSNIYDTYDELFTHVVHNHPLNQQPQESLSLSSLSLSSAATTTATSTSADAAHSLPTQSSASTNHSENRTTSVSNALNRAAEVFTIQPHGFEQDDLLSFMVNTRLQIRNYLLSRLSSQQSVKWYLCIQIELEWFSATEDNIR